MPSNDERREVAAKLRELEATKYWERDFFSAAFTDSIIGDYAAALGVERRASVGEFLDRLADLIEPEERTCEVMHWGGGVFYLSCGHDSREWPKPSYCPECGARVIGG